MERERPGERAELIEQKHQTAEKMEESSCDEEEEQTFFFVYFIKNGNFHNHKSMPINIIP